MVAEHRRSLQCVPSAVQKHRWETANARITALEYLFNGFAGQPIGGFLVAIGFGLALGVTGFAYVVGAVLLLLLVGNFKVAATTRKRSVNEDIREGIRFLWQHRLLRTMALLIAIMAGCWAAWLALIPVYAVGGPLGLDERQYGLLLTCLGAGGVIGTVIVGPVNRWIGRRWSMFTDIVGAFALVAAPALLPAAPSSAWAIGAAAFLAGAGGTMWTVNSRFITQSLVPADMLGRFSAASRLVAWGMTPVAAILAGILAEVFSYQVAFGFFAVLCVLLIYPFFKVVTRERMAEVDGPAAGPARRPTGARTATGAPAPPTTAGTCRRRRPPAAPGERRTARRSSRGSPTRSAGIPTPGAARRRARADVRRTPGPGRAAGHPAGRPARPPAPGRRALRVAQPRGVRRLSRHACGWPRPSCRSAPTRRRNGSGGPAPTPGWTPCSPTTRAAGWPTRRPDRSASCTCPTPRSTAGTTCRPSGGRTRTPAAPTTSPTPCSPPDPPAHPRGCRSGTATSPPTSRTASQAYRVGPGSRLSQTFELTFDPSVFDMFVAWTSGALLVVAAPGDDPGPRPLRERQPDHPLVLRTVGDLPGPPPAHPASRQHAGPAVEPVRR